jgi:formylglycine-generating enzyme required for sulfatase activity
MLSNVRRKRVQRIDIESCDEFNGFGIWWFKDLLVYGVQYANLGNQRYSNETTQKSFEYFRMKPNLIPYYKVNDEIYNMILCPSGTFTKGSNDPQDNNTIEEKKIEKSFLLGETEITQELYQVVMGVKNPSEFKNAKNPVENVSWGNAVMFCNRLSDMFNLERYYRFTDGEDNIIDTIDPNFYYEIEVNEKSKGFRLPTEWEWEYAAKAGTQLLYSGSNNVGDVGKITYKTYPIKQKKPNAWGFYDMSGNVSEWCEDVYDPEDGNGNSSYAHRVTRGGSFDDTLSVLRTTYRNSYPSKEQTQKLGFRVCRYI